MRKLALLAAAFALALGANLATADEVSWTDNRDEAFARAKKEGKIVLADFTGTDWCAWCIKLKDEVWETKEFKDWAAKNVVLLEVDFPKKKAQTDEVKKANREFAKKYGIKGYPTVVFMDCDGQEVGRNGYVKGGPAAWIKSADAILAKKGGKKEVKPDDKAEKTEGGTWIEGWDKAAAAAKKANKIILADFTGSDWCGWCMKLKKEVFDTADFKKWAGENVILLEVDFPQAKAQSEDIKASNAKLQEKYGIQGYPTILFLDADGNKIGEMGYQPGGPGPWTEKAGEIVKSKK